MEQFTIFINKDRCNGCGACVKICLYGAIAIVHEKAELDANRCTVCSLCLNVCETTAIGVAESKKKITPDDAGGVWVYIEHNGSINPACLQILSKGYELAARLTDELTAVVVGKCFDNIEALNQILTEYGADSVKLLVCEKLHTYQPEDVSRILAEEIRSNRPQIVLFLGSGFGRMLAPRVAANLKTGLTADCTDLYMDEKNRLVQVRPTYGGKFLATIICPDYRPQMASVRPNVFESKRIKTTARKCRLSRRTVSIDSVETTKRIVRTARIDTGEKPLDETDVVVCGGFGVGSREGFTLLKALANTLGGTVAGTRKAVDQGWIDFSRQIGQTGRAVRPRVYIACGVSGAVHHLMGMRHAKRIIVVNKDPRAPIFKIATLGIIGDLFTVIPKLIDALSCRAVNGKQIADGNVIE